MCVGVANPVGRDLCVCWGEEVVGVGRGEGDLKMRVLLQELRGGLFVCVQGKRVKGGEVVSRWGKGGSFLCGLWWWCGYWGVRVCLCVCVCAWRGGGQGGGEGESGRGCGTGS